MRVTTTSESTIRALIAGVVSRKLALLKARMWRSNIARRSQYDHLPALAADLVRRQVAAIVATGGNAAGLAARRRQRRFPVVFSGGADPVRLGLVASLNRPGGNVTGAITLISEAEPKRLGLLRELVPTAALVAVLVSPSNANADYQLKTVQEAARNVGQQIRILHAITEQNLDTAFVTMSQLQVGALLVAADPFFNSQRDHIVALAARHAIPAIYEQREFAVAGGHGKLWNQHRRSPTAIARLASTLGGILKGEKPADLPVMQSTRFEFVINLKTARVLGLDVPPLMLVRADEVIE